MPGDSKRKQTKEADRVLSTNPQAGHLYYLLERYEAGLVLLGTEVKAIREGSINLRDAYVNIREEEAHLLGCHIGAYSSAGYATHDPTRPRKLLLHKRELKKLQGKLTLRGYTLVPTKLYLKSGRMKLELALGEGKKLHDKREATRRKEVDREVRREMKERR
jgi:SsrA-binding protein